MKNLDNAGFSHERLQRIEMLMTNYVSKTRIPGIVTLLFRKGEIVHHQAFGSLSPEQQDTMPLDGIFRIYSMTKPIICTAFLMLYEQGKCQLFDPISWYIPSLKNLKVFTGEIAHRRNHVSKRTVFRASELIKPIREVTIYDLLTHTSGVTYNWSDTNQPLAEFVDELQHMPLAFQPGTRFHPESYYAAVDDFWVQAYQAIVD